MAKKRYGRNQKRQHRQRIAQLERDYGRSYQKVVELRETIERMVDVIEGVSKHSVVLPPKQMRGREPRKSLRIALHRHVLGAAPYPRKRLDQDVPHLGRDTVNVNMLRLFLEQYAETFAKAVHLEYVAGGHVAYMLSQMALETVPEEMLVERVARDLVRLLRSSDKQTNK